MEYLNTRTIAKDLGLNLRTIQKYIKEGFLPGSFIHINGQKEYKINYKDYLDWKQKYFSGVKRGNINKYTRSNKQLKASEIEKLVPLWLQSLADGTFNGRVYSKTTIEAYKFYIHHYLRSLGPRAAKPIISKFNLKEVYSKISASHYATKQKIYDSIMCFSKFLIEENKFTEEERDQIKKLKPRRFLPASKISLSERQIEAALNASQVLSGNNSYSRLLTKTLIIVLKETGLRVSELCNLKLADVDLENRVVYVWLGKGNKNRKVGITMVCYQALVEYWQARIDTESDSFFVSRSGIQLTRNSLRLRWNRLSRVCGFKITSHSFRRSFVTINVNKGKPLVHLQIAAGHTDIKTTRGYCTTGVDEVIEAMRGW